MKARHTVVPRAARARLLALAPLAAAALLSGCELDVSPRTHDAQSASSSGGAGMDSAGSRPRRLVGDEMDSLDLSDAADAEAPDAGETDAAPPDAFEDVLPDAAAEAAPDAAPDEAEDAAITELADAAADAADDPPDDAGAGDAGDAAPPDPPDCVDGETRVVACGRNGRGEQDQFCDAGEYHDAGTCSDPDVCTDGAMRTVACGLHGNGSQAQRCVVGAWQSTGSCNDPDWTCPLEYYATRDGCDCECGSRDPDCDVDDQELFNCSDGEICDAAGECVDLPGAWSCEPNFYATLDGCDCECGAYDLDCAVPGQMLFNCEDGQTCSASGECQGG